MTCAPRLFGYLFTRRRDASRAVPKLRAWAAANICFASGSFRDGSMNFSGGGSLPSNRSIDGSAAEAVRAAMLAQRIRVRANALMTERIEKKFRLNKSDIFLRRRFASCR